MPAADEHTVTDLLNDDGRCGPIGWQQMEQVHDNRGWTSPRGARKIRKAEAVERFATVLAGHDIVSTSDIERAADPTVKPELRAIPGQPSRA